MMNLTHPRYVLPVHGDFKRLRLHAELAGAVGIGRRGRLPGRERPPARGRPPAARAWASGSRPAWCSWTGWTWGTSRTWRCATAGCSPPTASSSWWPRSQSQDGRSVAAPEVIFRGVPFLEEADGLVEDIRGAVVDSLSRSADEDVREISLLQDHLHDDVARFVYDRLRRRPMVLPWSWRSERAAIGASAPPSAYRRSAWRSFLVPRATVAAVGARPGGLAGCAGDEPPRGAAAGRGRADRLRARRARRRVALRRDGLHPRRALPDRQPHRAGRRAAVHAVRLRAFRIDRLEVTNGDYARFLDGLGLRPRGDARAGRVGADDLPPEDVISVVEGRDGRERRHPHRPRRPARAHRHPRRALLGLGALARPPRHPGDVGRRARLLRVARRPAADRGGVGGGRARTAGGRTRGARRGRLPGARSSGAGRANAPGRPAAGRRNGAGRPRPGRQRRGVDEHAPRPIPTGAATAGRTRAPLPSV